MTATPTNVTAWVISKATRAPDARGYRGPACVAAGVPKSKIYTDHSEAQADATRMSAYNPVGFTVHPRPVESLSYMTQARHRWIAKHGVTELQQAVRAGKVSPAAGAIICRLPASEQVRQLNEHLQAGGNALKWRGSHSTVGKAPALKHDPKPPILPTTRFTSSDGLVEQTYALLHRLREVADKTKPLALYDRIPERMRHNLELSLEPAADFLLVLRALHRGRRGQGAKKTAG